MAIKDNLIAYWNFEESSGNLIDVHTGTHTLTETGGTIASVGGKVGNCRDFELGDTEWFTKAHHDDLGNVDEDMTIACWAQLETKNNYSNIISKGTHSGTGVYTLGYRVNIDRLRFTLFGAASFGSEGSIPADNFGSPPLATWMFVVAWHDATADTVNIQVNNGTANSLSHSAGGHSESGGLYLGGGFPWESGPGEFWDGLIDECGFWKRVLTADEKTWLYNSGNGRTYSDFTVPLTFTGTSNLNG